jgi:hypothetical protein
MVFELFVFDTGFLSVRKVLVSSPGKSFTSGNLRQFQSKQCPLDAMNFFYCRQMMKNYFEKEAFYSSI